MRIDQRENNTAFEAYGRALDLGIMLVVVVTLIMENGLY